MELEELDIPGCFLARPRRLADDRGHFVKMFPAPEFGKLGLDTNWREELYTSSRRGVVRGMHFQTPPAEQAKLLFCVAGEVLDVLVDLRRGSPGFGRHFSIRLSAENGLGLYVPSGVAHGFAALAEDSVIFYKINGDYSAEHDRGIAWNGFGFDWPALDPILSERDRGHPTLAEFDSPFIYDPAGSSA